MVAKINRGASLYGALLYNQEKINEGTARIIWTNRMIADTSGKPQTIIRQTLAAFEPYLAANRKTEKPVLHISLNPSPDDRLTDGQFCLLAREYMGKMNYADQPCLVYMHEDTGRRHVHNCSGMRGRDRMEFMRAISILFCVIHIYWFCYQSMIDFGIHIGVVDTILLNFNRTTGLFAPIVWTKLFAVVFLALSCLGTRGVKAEKIKWSKINTCLFFGFILFFLNGRLLYLPLPLTASFIKQQIGKGYAAYLYDYKFDDLSLIAYNTLLNNLDKYRVKPQFFVINFDNPRRSHRCNPINPGFMTDISDAYEAAYTIMLNLNRSWIQKQGDFFVESPIILLAAIIWYLRIYQDGIYCTFPHAVEFLNKPYADIFTIRLKSPYPE